MPRRNNYNKTFTAFQRSSGKTLKLHNNTFLINNFN